MNSSFGAAERGRVAGVDDELDVEAPRELLCEPVAERREMDVRDVQDSNLVTAPERVRLDGRVRARGTRDDAAELVTEVPDALDRALDGTEELWHQTERARVARSLERRRVEPDRRQPDREDDREQSGDRGSKDLQPSVPEREQSEGRRAGDAHQDDPPREPSRCGQRVPLDLGGHGVDPSSEPLLQRLRRRPLGATRGGGGGAVGVGSEPPERGERDVGHAPAEVGLELDLEGTGVDRRLRERLECERRPRDADEDRAEEPRPAGHASHGGHRSSGPQRPRVSRALGSCDGSPSGAATSRAISMNDSTNGEAWVADHATP